MLATLAGTMRLGANLSSAEKRVAGLLAERIKDGSGIRLAASGEQARFWLVIRSVASGTPEATTPLDPDANLDPAGSEAN